MNYPLISEYIEAIKFAEDNFEQLKHLRPVLDESGEPVMSGGNFAVVFKMKDEQTGKLHAVKCFLREQEGRAGAYRMIEDELEHVNSSFLTPFKYLNNEVFVDSKNSDETEFPVLLMDWIEGQTLDKYLRENIDDQYALEMLAYRFSQLAQWLVPQPFAHGDLKPDNILVRKDGTIVLVDYDGMYVPAMKGQKARELGSPDFRHPLRTEDDFDEHIDDFPCLSVLLSLLIISKKPSLLEKYGAVDKLLFSYSDFHDIRECVILKECIPSGDSEIDRLYCLFIEVYYDCFLPTIFYSSLQLNRPIFLIPFNNRRYNNKSLFDRINGKLLTFQYNYIDFVDSTLQSSTSCIISNECGDWTAIGYTNAAIVSCPKDLSDVIWYKRLFAIGKSRTRFIAVDYLDRFGIIDDNNKIILDFVFQEIKAIEIGENVFLECKKSNRYGLLDKELKTIIPCILQELVIFSWLKIVIYRHNDECTFALDLLSLKEYKLPSDYKKIEDYKEGIFMFEVSDNNYKFYSCERQCYINNYTYQKLSRNENLRIKKSYDI